MVCMRFDYRCLLIILNALQAKNRQNVHFSNQINRKLTEL